MPKDNPFSDNPFGTAQDDPFAAPAATGKGSPSAWGANGGGAFSGNSNAWGSNGGGAYSGPSAPPTNAFVDLGSGGGGYGGKSGSRADLLDMKEKELNAREEEIKRREEELRKAGALAPKKNWPFCYPILHHDISADVPDRLQHMVRKAYWSWLGFFVAVTFNWFGSLMALCVISPANGRLPGFLLANIYWFAGLPGAWILWYMRIYNASRNDRALTYAWFFLMYLIHIAFCTWAAISPPLIYSHDWGHAGFITGIDAFNDSTFVGVVYMIGGGLWAIEVLWSIWVMKVVYFNFRSGGGGAKLQQEVAQTAVKQGLSGRGGMFSKKGSKKAGPLSNAGASDVPSAPV